MPRSCGYGDQPKRSKAVAEYVWLKAGGFCALYPFAAEIIKQWMQNFGK